MRAPKMLIVDSQPTIAETIAEIFVRSGYEMRVRYNGESALEAALEWQPSVAIIEFILTGMNGLDCANELLAGHPDCKVILIYAQVAEHLIDAAGRAALRYLRSRLIRRADRHRWRASQRTDPFKVRLLEQANNSLKLRAQIPLNGQQVR